MTTLFRDITNCLPSSGKERVREYKAKEVPHIVRTRNDPYNAKVLPDDFSCFSETFEDSSKENLYDKKVLKVVVQFKCHRAEFKSLLNVAIGEFVIVEGDRGEDIGVVMSTEYVAASCAPQISVLESATQNEVDYWAGDLKQAENDALETCRNYISTLRLNMSALQAEYQFDKKKLSIYYTAPDRVQYDALTKELYRLFECRIWFAKVGYSDGLATIGHNY